MIKHSNIIGCSPPFTCSKSEVPSTGRSSVTVNTRSSVGRIPTPKINTKPHSRHHLDLTTPAVGGALLSSPPQAPPSSRSGSVKFKPGKLEGGSCVIF